MYRNQCDENLCAKQAGWLICPLVCLNVGENLSNYSFDFSAMTLLAYLSPHSHHKITINA